MFIETHEDNGINMTFLKSLNVEAYPCGRRRSALIEHDFNENDKISEDEKYSFPFDPEARLNTEANNRKHSSLNGYTQTYLISDWNSSQNEAIELTLALSGYLFNIKLDASGYKKANDFANSVLTALDIDHNDADVERIYANILIEKVKLLSTGFKEYATGILRNQSQSGQRNNIPSEALDLLAESFKSTANASKNANNYYFSGLSFSTVPLTSIKNNDNIGKTRSVEVTSITYVDIDFEAQQTLVSLCILKKNGDSWEVNEEARLPKIEHGDTEDSIVITGETLTHSDISVEGNINVVGTPDIDQAADEGAILENTGNITAKHDITAERNLTAKQNLQVDGDATIDNKATIKGEAELQKNLVVGIDGDTNTGTIEAKSLIKTTKLKVNNSSIDDDAKGSIDTDSITTDNIITKLASICEDLTVGGKADIDGNITSNSNIEAKGTTEYAGNILADRNIIAGNDITADRFLNVKDNAKILKNLTVGPEEDGDGAGDPGTIEAKALIKTPELTVVTDDEKGQITADNITINKALDAQEVIVGDVDELDGVLTVNGDTKILGHTDVDTLEASTITVGTLPTEGDDESFAIAGYPATSIIGGNIITSSIGAKFSIVTPRLTADAIGAGTINARDINQKIGDGEDDYYDVPVIFLEEQDNGYFQLKISRVNKIAKT